MSDTPETFEFASKLRGLGTGYYQALDLCRKLERERDEARNEVERLKDKFRNLGNLLGDPIGGEFQSLEKAVSDLMIESAMKGAE